MSNHVGQEVQDEPLGHEEGRRREDKDQERDGTWLWVEAQAQLCCRMPHLTLLCSSRGVWGPGIPFSNHFIGV